MYIERDAEQHIVKRMAFFPVMVVTGARQAGKTTLMRKLFPEWAYFNLESPATRALAEADPVSFVSSHQDGLLLDEVQRMPELLSYVQAAVDEDRRAGRFVLSGSQNILLGENVGQTLAGRAAYYEIAPLSYRELLAASLADTDVFTEIFNGGYPGQRKDRVPPELFFDAYLATYVERDVRQVKNISDLSLFRKFMLLLAGRTGQVVDYTSLANDVGVSPGTVRGWISVLEAGYIVRTLPPYFNNFGKRYIKSPKIYFKDTGLLCYLLGISSAEAASQHFMRGNLFENYVILEIEKILRKRGARFALYFYRESHGNEIDLVVETEQQTIPIEIKSSATFSKAFMKGIRYWENATGSESQPSFIIYGGPGQTVGNTTLLRWTDLDQIGV